MANVAVALVLFAKGENGWIRVKPVQGGNGRIRPGYGMVDGQPQRFEKYTYQLRTYEGTRLAYETVGTDAQYANAQLLITKRKREAAVAGRAAGLTVVEDSARRTVAKAIDEYIEQKKDKQVFVAAQVYRTSLDLLRQALPDVTYVDQLNEGALLRFHAHLRKRGNSARTISNRHAHVKSFLLWCGVSREEAQKKIGTAPKFDKKTVLPYSHEEVSTLLAYCRDDRYLFTVLSLLLMSGLREREASHLMWADIDFKREHIHVRSKPEMGFRLKDNEERIVDLPPRLAAILRERRKVSPNSSLVVGTDKDTPHVKWLRSLKQAARKAGLDCGSCNACRQPRKPVQRRRKTGRDGWGRDGGCQRWTLHNFRRTYATALDEAGFSLKQIMDLLGHADIQTTMRYLGNRSRSDNRRRIKTVNW
jgi:integrase